MHNIKYTSHRIFFTSHSSSFKSMTPKEQLEISTPLYSCEKDEFKLQKKLGANTQIPTFQMLFPAEQSLVSVQTPEAQNTMRDR